MEDAAENETTPNQNEEGERSKRPNVINKKVERIKQPLISLLTFSLLGVSTFLTLKPVLTTNVGADDLLNPFSQLFHVGTDPITVLRSSSRLVSATGHFNYLGQAIGSLAVLAWTVLVGQLGIHFNTVYAATKLLTYSATIASGVWLIRLIRFGEDTRISRARTWVLVTLALILPLQIHIPWSNDPVASYPLSGFLTAASGIAFIGLAHSSVGSTNWARLSLAGLVGVAIVLYYEFNSFAVLAAAPPIASLVWRARSEVRRVLLILMQSAVVVGPASIVTLYFFFRNRAGSAAYTGTVISLSPPFPTTFRNALVSALPASSWRIGSDWLGFWPNMIGRQLLPLVAGLLLLAVVWWLPQLTRSQSAMEPSSTNMLSPVLMTASLLIYWFGATFTQAGTLKVQQEAVRIGQVYNYYAVGALCFGLIAVIGVVSLRRRQVIAATLLVVTCVIGLGQYSVNHAVMKQYNAATSSTQGLLNSIDPAVPNDQRCAALDSWKSVGWPEYYWLDMELGLQRIGEIYWQQPFCQR